MEPERTCIGCRARRPKRSMLRIARAAEGAVAVDPTGSAPGRGAYVCGRASCVEAAVTGALSRALRASLGGADLARLRREMERELA